MKITTIKEALAAGYWFSWDSDYEIGSHVQEFGSDIYSEEPDTCEILTLFGPDGELIDSLGCIDDATEESRREYELAMLSEIPEPDTYATDQIDALVPSEFCILRITADADADSATKHLNISPEELAEIRDVLARRTV